MLTDYLRTRLAAYTAGAAIGTPVTHLSLHTAIPNASGSSELTGGSPAYARKPVSWGTAVTGVLPQTGSCVFNVPASTVVAVGMWDALTAGNFLGFLPSNGGTLFGYGMGRAGLPILSPGHGLVTGDSVQLAAPKPAVLLPTGYAADVLYKVTVNDADQFTVADPGTLITVIPSSSAAVLWQRYVSDVFAVQGTLTISGVQLAIGA